MVTSRIWFTAAQKAELWERWKNGQSAAAIFVVLSCQGRTRPALSVSRYCMEVSCWRRAGESPAARSVRGTREDFPCHCRWPRRSRQIAQGLGRAPSTGAGRSGATAASQADRASWPTPARRGAGAAPRSARFALQPRRVTSAWRRSPSPPQWSPQEISGWLEQ